MLLDGYLKIIVFLITLVFSIGVFVYNTYNIQKETNINAQLIKTLQVDYYKRYVKQEDQIESLRSSQSSLITDIKNNKQLIISNNNKIYSSLSHFVDRVDSDKRDRIDNERKFILSTTTQREKIWNAIKKCK